MAIAIAMAPRAFADETAAGQPSAGQPAANQPVANQAPAAQALPEGADPRVRASLEEAGIKYSVNQAGNFKVIFQMKDEDRSHMAFVVSKTSSYREVELREVWAVAAVLDEYPPEEVLHRLLSVNSTTKLGAWAIEQAEDGEIWLLYTAKVPAGLSPVELKDIIYFVAEVADEMEADISGDDEY